MFVLAFLQGAGGKYEGEFPGIVLSNCTSIRTHINITAAGAVDGEFFYILSLPDLLPQSSTRASHSRPRAPQRHPVLPGLVRAISEGRHINVPL